MIGEVPDPGCSPADQSSHLNQFVAVRQFIDSNIAGGNISNVNIPPVTVTGVAYVDFPHFQTGVAPNNIELHPILDMYFTPATGMETKPKKNTAVKILPNPFNTSTVIHIPAKAINSGACVFKLFDVMGREVREVSVPANNNDSNFTLKKDNLEPGIYIYRISNEGTPCYEGKLMVK